MDVTPVAALSDASSQTAPVTVERQISTYLSDTGRLAAGMPPQAGDPSSFFRRIFEGLNGFIETADKWSNGTLMTEMLDRSPGLRPHPGPVSASLELAGDAAGSADASPGRRAAFASLEPAGNAADAPEASPHGGPASARLAGTGVERTESPGRLDAAHKDILTAVRRTMEAASAFTGFSVKVSLFTSGMGQISSSVHALTRGT